MARPWRLRHKLFLGLALVIASIALLFAGALFGFSAYDDAMRTSIDKLNLMQVVAILRDQIHRLGVPPEPKELDDGTRAVSAREQERIVLLKRIEGDPAVKPPRPGAKDTVQTYRTMRAGMTAAGASDPDDGEGERAAIDTIDQSLSRLADTIRRFVPPPTPRGADRRLIDEPDVKAEYDKLVDESTGLFVLIKDHIEGAKRRAEVNHRRGLWVTGTGTCVAVIVVLTLLYYFKVWVFSPIRQLQAGVQRVHGGNFDQPIRLDSKDELEELADEFNAMTARLRDTYKDLARQVNERSRQLVRSERMVSVGFLAAGVAHEINNPLASIAFCSEALERRLQDLVARLSADDGEVLAKYLKVIQQEAFRCKQITQKLLDFSRTGERKREPTDLGRLIQDVIDVARLLPNHRAKRIEFAPAYLVAAVSPPDLKSVVLNLVVNALDSMDDGGVLAVSLSQGGPPGREFAELTFRDTGCGMTPDVLENIFEPFFTRRRTGNGTGLGLSISHQIIDQHGGTIHAASGGPGKGSTFVVRVPVREAVHGHSSLVNGQSSLVDGLGTVAGDDVARPARGRVAA